MSRLPMFDALLKAGLASAVMVLAPPAAVSATNPPTVPPTATYTVAPDVEGAVPLADAATLETLVAPVALYPDDLLSIVLPASTYPLQIVQAARFLDELKADPDLKPPADWDDAVVALLNYPEVVRMMDADLDWTWKLGEAVLNQEEDVVTAVAGFRAKAHDAGNLKTDERQIVEVKDEVVEIRPADPEVIYVPYYEPARVIVYQSTPAYYYYPQPRPVYYYPYPVDYGFASGYFWGVSSAYAIGWTSHHVYVHDHYHYRHPYYGHTYYARHNYRHYRHHRYDDHRRHRGHDDAYDGDRNHYDNDRYNRGSDGRGNYNHAGGSRSDMREPNQWRPNAHRAGARPGPPMRDGAPARNGRDGEGRRGGGEQTVAANRGSGGREASRAERRDARQNARTRGDDNPFAAATRPSSRRSDASPMALASSATPQQQQRDRNRERSRSNQADWMGRLGAAESASPRPQVRERGTPPQAERTARPEWRGQNRVQTQQRVQQSQRTQRAQRTTAAPRERDARSMNRAQERTAAAPRLQAPPRSVQPRHEQPRQQQPQMRAPQQHRQEQRVARVEQSAPRERGQQREQRQSRRESGGDRGSHQGGGRGNSPGREPSF